jgi:hypothetical protein
MGLTSNAQWFAKGVANTSVQKQDNHVVMGALFLTPLLLVEA